MTYRLQYTCVCVCVRNRFPHLSKSQPVFSPKRNFPNWIFHACTVLPACQFFFLSFFLIQYELNPLEWAVTPSAIWKTCWTHCRPSFFSFFCPTCSIENCEKLNKYSQTESRKKLNRMNSAIVKGLARIKSVCFNFNSITKIGKTVLSNLVCWIFWFWWCMIMIFEERRVENLLRLFYLFSR